MNSTKQVLRAEFFSVRNVFLQKRKNQSNLSERWQTHLQSWTEKFVSEHSADEVLTEISEWNTRIISRETKERIFDDAVEFSQRLGVENPLIKAPSLKSAKNMQMYFCQALTAVQEKLKNIH